MPRRRRLPSAKLSFLLRLLQAVLPLQGLPLTVRSVVAIVCQGGIFFAIMAINAHNPCPALAVDADMLQVEEGAGESDGRRRGAAEDAPAAAPSSSAADGAGSGDAEPEDGEAVRPDGGDGVVEEGAVSAQAPPICDEDDAMGAQASG